MEEGNVIITCLCVYTYKHIICIITYNISLSLHKHTRKNELMDHEKELMEGR